MPTPDNPTTLLAFGQIAAGLALFFTGIHFISLHLKRLTGRRVKEVMGRLTRHPAAAGAWGFLMGALTQSASGVAFLCVNLLASGLLVFSQAAVVVIWSNVGLSTIVLFATLDLHLLILWVVGIAGILFAFEKPARWLNVVGAIFGLGLLFYGLDAIKYGADILRSFPWFEDLVAQVEGWYFPAFVLGALLAAVAQSSAAVSIVAIILASSGLLGPDELLMIIYGTNVGDALVTWLLTLNLRGSGKQLAMVQVLFNPLGALVFVPLFYIEYIFHVPLVQAALLKLSGGGIEQFGSLAYLVFNLGTAIPLHFFRAPLLRAIERRYPPDPIEDAGRPQFLSPVGLRDPEVALEQACRELQALGKRLPQYLHPPSDPAAAASQAAQCASAFETVAEEARYFLEHVVEQRDAPECARGAANLLERLEILLTLNRVLQRLAPRSAAYRSAGREDDLGHLLLEGIEAALLTVLDAVDSEDPEDISLALTISGDSGGTMSKLREIFLQSESGLSHAARAQSLQTLGYCERLVFVLHSLARSLRDAAAPASTA